MAPAPRTIKTHLPFSLLPPDILETCKVVYVTRNLRDVCVSLLPPPEFLGLGGIHRRLFRLYLQAPFWGHLKEAWAKRQHRNLLFLFYEDMKENHMREVKRLDAFLGTGLSEEQLRQVAEHTSISQMKSRSSVNPPLSVYTERARKEGRKDFIRKGAIGDWVNYFTPELETKFQAWLKTGEEIAKEIPFKYKAELADTSGK
ncbi:hypothetical protein O3P69_011031 [Scylla paramamosain]|uniref:Sulfotransferase domain-containing protein n=1 Tax=Scylla paramamosain TaxID=85552 RepID=A0AAW0SCX9_SCYPA